MALLFLLWAFKIYDSKGAILFRTPLDIPLLGFFVWAGLSLLWTVDLHESLNSWIALGKQIFLFYLVATTVKTKDQFVKILGAFLSAMLITDIYAIADFFYRGGSLLDRHIRAGSFGSLDYNLLTILIVIFLPLGFIFGIISENKKLKTGLYLFSLISLLALYLGYTRAGWITVIFQLLIFGWFYNRLFFIKVLAGIIVSFGLFVFTLPIIEKYNANATDSNAQVYADTLDPGNLTVRIKVWKFGLQEILKHPILGKGYGREIFQKVYQDKEFIRITPHLHNILLETVFELGIPGFLLLIVCFWKITSKSFRMARLSNDKFSTFFGFFMITMFSGFLFKNLFDHMFIGNISEIFWVLSGLLFTTIPKDKIVDFKRVHNKLNFPFLN